MADLVLQQQLKRHACTTAVGFDVIPSNGIVDLKDLLNEGC
ncbi:MAG: hypothetical protein Q8K82_05590 [Gemmatimonadaceae bacterium]|nr:hypothetical protein [Gemmatimonadaceae bacterium]